MESSDEQRKSKRTGIDQRPKRSRFPSKNFLGLCGAYPLGLKASSLAKGNTYEEPMAEFKSAIGFHVRDVRQGRLGVRSPLLEAFVAEAEMQSDGQVPSPTLPNACPQALNYWAPLGA